MQEFIEFIEEILQDRKISLNEFAEDIGRSVSAVRRWKYGLFFPAPDTVISIALKYNISCDYMFGLSLNKELVRKYHDTTFYQRYLSLLSQCKAKPFDIVQKKEISNGAVYSWKRIKAFPDMNSLIVLAKEYGTTLDYLLGIG